ncbi:MAG: hypothetical protein EBS55_14320 [Flavobacteriaceae bacterium]|nr:hypothetical protein [Flavobacteriaceae bacterium]
MKSFNEVKEVLKDDKRFILGVGGVKSRSFFYKKMVNAGGIHFSVCSKNIIARSFDQKIKLADIFTNTFLGPNIQIRVDTLINTRSNIYHDTIIGDFVILLLRQYC